MPIEDTMKEHSFKIVGHILRRSEQAVVRRSNSVQTPSKGERGGPKKKLLRGN